MSPFSEKQGFVSTYVGFVRDHWRLIGSTAILVAALAAVAVSQQREQYRTSIQVLFRETTIGQQVAGVPIFESPQANSTAGSEMTTNVTLLGSESVAKDVIRKARIANGRAALLQRVAVSQVGLSNIGEITVRADDPREAQTIADAWGESFIAQRRAADQAKLGGAIDLLNQRLSATPEAEQRSTVARETRQQLQRLELLKSVQDGNAEVVYPPACPLSRSPRGLSGRCSSP